MVPITKNAYGFAEEVVLVTGGAMGIGAGIAEVLAQARAVVVIADIDVAQAEQRARELIEAGHKADHVPLNLADEDSIIHAVQTTVAKHGALWGLVNNAGIQDRQLLLEGTAEEWDRVHAVNTRGAFLITREAARNMVAAGKGGRIVNIASVALIGGLTQGHAIYAASKAALLGLTRAAALELVQHKITVNTVLPGGVATPGAIGARGPVPEGPGRRVPPLGRCEPRDIAAAVLFLASPLARSITNQTLAVDGGWSVT
jgi:NAD(P)-dependent dehydrogenase (short-subunit alcohol dehydrogenase family)